MAEITLDWIAGQRFLGIDSTGHTIVLSPPNDIALQPADTLLIALAACSAYDLVTIIAKRRAKLHRLAVQVTATQAEQPPRGFRTIHLRYNVGAADLTLAQLQRAIDLALNKYCTVRASL